MKPRKMKIKIVITIIVLIMCIWLSLYLIFVSRNSRQCVKSEVIKVELLKAEDYINNLSMRNNYKRGNVLENYDDYVCLHYKIKAKNTSTDYIVQKIKFEPEFTKEMKDSIVAYNEEDEISDKSKHTTLNKNQERSYGRIIIIKKNGLSDDEIIEKAKANNFLVSYYTSNDKNSIFTLGHSKQIIPSVK